MKKVVINKRQYSGGGNNQAQDDVPLNEREWAFLVIRKAEYNTWRDPKSNKDKLVLDIWFEGIPDDISARVFSAYTKGGDEFAITEVFRFANAGIKSANAVDGESEKYVVEIDDNPVNLIGKRVAVFPYKNGKYWQIYNKVAPAEPFENPLEKVTEAIINYTMLKAESDFEKYVEPKLYQNR
jgi:hypothetical protein